MYLPALLMVLAVSPPALADTGALDTGEIDTGTFDTGGADTKDTTPGDTVSTDTGSIGGSDDEGSSNDGSSSDDFVPPDEEGGYGTTGSPAFTTESSDGCQGGAAMLLAPLLLIGRRRTS